TFQEKYDIQSTNLSKNNIGIINFHLKQTLYFIKSILYIIILKYVKITSPYSQRYKSLYFTRYPKHFNDNERDSKYGSLFQDDDYYLISIIADGFHQKLNLTDYYNCLKRLKRASFKYILIDSYLSIGDGIKALFYSFKLYKKSRIIRDNSFIFDNIDITDHVRLELFTSLQRIPRLMMYHKGFIGFINNNIIDRFILYLFEFAYGRYFTYLLRKYSPNTIITGFQHGPNSQRHIMFFLG
ncbi:uncharacterized protein METZ01_LOCUS488979, partial [marine metagenome]